MPPAFHSAAAAEAAGRQDAQARTLYASQLQSLKNNRKRAAGELEGLLRSDAVRQRIAQRLKEAQNTAAMLTTFNDVDMSAVMGETIRRAHHGESISTMFRQDAEIMF